MKKHFCRKPDESALLYGLKITGWIILGITAFAAFAFLLGILIVYLWNWLMPALFGLKTITFWQAVGLLVLARIIFGGIKGGSHHSHPGKKHKAGMTHAPCNHNGNYGKWAYYDEYWNEVGEKSFDEFVRTRKGTQSDPVA